MKKILFITLTLILFISSTCTFLKKDKTKIDHIFLITIDTLRADHLGCYGYPRNTSPFIDSLAEKGILFEKAYSQSSTTCPSHASIFTGLYQSQHRVVANGYVLDDSYITLAEILSDNGVNTVGLASTFYHFLRSNINQGFGFYEQPEKAIRTYGFEYRQANHTINNAQMWLYNFDINEKLFMWIHLFDPHIPFYPPDKYYKLMDKNIKKGKFLKFLEKRHINLESFENDIEKMYTYITNYDAEIRYVDEELKRLFNFVDEKGLNKNSLWIITSDHGEALGQHDWLMHGKTLYQEEMHVPLIFYFPQNVIPPSKIEDVVENFDIFSTTLDFFNIKLDKDIEKKVMAVSLMDKIKNHLDLEKKHAFSERRFFEEKAWPEHVPEWRRNSEEGEKYCVQTEDFKLIYNTVLGEQFYDLRNDPSEMNNLENTDNDTSKEALKRIILRNLNVFKEHRNRKIRKVDRKTIERLKSLGYIF